MTLPTATRLRFALLLLPALAACDQTGAYGDVSSIIVAADSTLWGEVGDSVEQALQPSIRTTRDELTFTVTYQDPSDEMWGNLRKFRQMLVIGRPDDPWVREALESGGHDDVSPPEVLRADDVWARGQLVTILVVPEEGRAAAVRSRLADLSGMYDDVYRQWTLARMFVSGRDTALADTLAREAGFSLLLPQVYYWDRRDSVYIFRNDNPDPSELIRQITVTWQTPIPEGLQGEDLVEWRQAIAEEYYQDDQVADLTQLVDAGPFRFREKEAYRLQAVWENPPGSDWPAAGPFLLRSVICPEQDRLYLIDAWLYAPGKEKYEYMLQLETLLDSFRCGSEGAAR